MNFSVLQRSIEDAIDTAQLTHSLLCHLALITTSFRFFPRTVIDWNALSASTGFNQSTNRSEMFSLNHKTLLLLLLSVATPAVTGVTSIARYSLKNESRVYTRFM